MFKSTINSKKSTSLQPHTTINAKINKFENRNAIPPLINRSKYKLCQKSSTSDTIDTKKMSTTKSVNRKPNSGKKSNIPINSNAKIMPANKIFIRPNKRVSKLKTTESSTESPKTETASQAITDISEIGIQTNENEILNHSLIVGDHNILTPSKAITDEIAKVKRDCEMNKLMLSTRKFEEHSLQEEQHLDDLKEFLDKNYITRKHKDILEEDRKIIESMDELLQRERPKTESITDIKRRIKYKEQELLKLFDNFQQTIENFDQIKICSK